MRQRKLQTKILLPVGCTILIVLAISTLMSMQAMKKNYLEALELRSEALAQGIIRTVLSRYQLSPNLEVLLESLSLLCIEYYDLNQEKGVSHFAVISPSGKIAAHNNRDLWSVAVENPDLLMLLEQQTMASILEGDIYHSLVPIFGKQQEFLGTVDIGFPASLITEKTKSLLLNSLMLLLLSCIGTFFIVSIFIRSIIIRPLLQLVAIVHTLSEGQLSQIATARRTDEIGQLHSMIWSMVERWGNAIEDVQHSAAEVESGAQELRSSLTRISEGATLQAAAAEEISSSMEQMSANIRQNTEHAIQAEKLVVVSAEETEASGKTVTLAVNAIQEIAKKIVVIDDIARQTRLLSLNATIESARAKDYGKGFAVVANEVRTLADRSRQAATEITEEANSSVELAEKADQMLQHLTPCILRTAELVQEISSASREQDSGTQHITQAVTQLEQTIQKNVLVSEQGFATAEKFAAQAKRLQGAVAFFQRESQSPENNIDDNEPRLPVYSDPKSELPL